MNLLLDRLREFVPRLDVDPAALAAALTLVGVAVERVTRAADGSPVLETEITTNRPDLLSYLGTAREIAARYRLSLRPPDTAPPESASPVAGAAAVSVEAPDACPRYTARVVAGVTVGPSPEWLRRILEASGIRSINNVVDATNLVLLELGHPTHAFDLARLEGRQVIVRAALAGETLVTLDGTERKLAGADLVIADARRPVALAGVLGGAETEISAATRDVLIESAFFDPLTVRRTARRHGLRTEASIRFERRADPEGTAAAADRVARLLAELTGGEVRAGRLDVRAAVLPSPTIRLRLSRMAQVLGLTIPAEEVRRILEALGFQVGSPGDAIEVGVPGFRGDVEREIDLIEEVGRHHGYEHIPARLPATDLAPPGLTGRQQRERLLRRVLESAGFSEAVTLSMVDPAREAPLVPAGTAFLRIQNPLSDRLSAMRATVLGGLLEVIGHNLRRGAEAVSVYELAHVFAAPGGDPHETLRLGLAAVGPGVDERSVKGVLDGIGSVLRLGALAVEPGGYPSRPARFAWAAGGTGELHRVAPEALAACDLDRSLAVHAAEIDIEAALEHQPGTVRYRGFSRFPASTRDVSLWTGGVRYADIVAAVRALGEPLLESILLADRWVAADGKSSLTLRLTYRHPERTLGAEEVQAAHDRVLDALGRDARIALRLG